MKKWLKWGIPAIVLLALIGWRFSVTRASEAQTNTTQRARMRSATVVEVATAQGRTIVQRIQSVGNVDSPYKVEVAPKTTGRISRLDLREGDTVKVGQVLLEIDPSDLNGAVVQAQANVAEAKSRLAQAALTQGSTNVGISSQIRQQKSAVASAQADLNQVRNNYDSQVQQAQAQRDAAASEVANAQAALRKEQANLDNANVKYDRTNNLYKQGFVAAQDVDDAKTAVAVEQGGVGVQQAQVNSAKSQLSSQEHNLQIVKRKGQSDIADSAAKLSQAKATLDVALANRSQSPAYEANLAALRSTVSAAEAGLAQAQSRLADTVLRSSINGTVTARKADPGALGSPGTPVLEIQFLDWVFVNTSVPIEASAQVHAGQTARITFDSVPGREFMGHIVNLNPAADQQSRQFGVSIRLENPDHLLRPGMYARVTIETSQVAAPVTVPREAMKTNPDGTTSVTVVDKDGTAHVRTVRLGVSDDKGSQVLEGVNAGDQVVVLTYTPIKDGAKVTIGKPGETGGGGQGGPAGQQKRRRQAPTQ